MENLKMNSGYLREDGDGHWYHIPEQYLELFDWGLDNPEKSRNLDPELFTGKKNQPPINMTGEEIVEGFEMYMLDYPPSYYKTILFLPGQ
jgi:hypothetical protein